jgi:catalase
MSFYNRGARPNYLSSIEPIQFRERSVNLDQTHGYFTGRAITFLSEMGPEDFNAPRKLWLDVFDDGAKERFINNVAGKMEVCAHKEILKRRIAIFREVHPDIATRLDKATGIKGYDGIANMQFNGTHNGMAADRQLRAANGMTEKAPLSLADNNGAPTKGTHAEYYK